MWSASNPYGDSTSRKNRGATPFSLDSITESRDYLELERFKIAGKVGIIVEMEVRYPVRVGETGWDMPEMFTGCLKCNKGVLIPLSDYGRDGAPIRYKAWVCNNPECGFNIRIDNGEISIGKELTFSTK
jgi:hypothetical protein